MDDFKNRLSILLGNGESVNPDYPIVDNTNKTMFVTTHAGLNVRMVLELDME